MGSDLINTKAQLMQATASLAEQDLIIRSLRLITGNQRQQADQIAKAERDPLSPASTPPVPFVHHQGDATGGLRPGLGHPRP